MIRVYVAGAYSGTSVLQVLGNMRRGIAAAHKLLMAGFAPFAPWFDAHYCLVSEVPLETLYAYSMEWLRASQAVCVVPEGAEQSRGVRDEVAEALVLKIPVFWFPGYAIERTIEVMRGYFYFNEPMPLGVGGKSNL